MPGNPRDATSNAKDPVGKRSPPDDSKQGAKREQRTEHPDKTAKKRKTASVSGTSSFVSVTDSQESRVCKENWNYLKDESSNAKYAKKHFPLPKESPMQPKDVAYVGYGIFFCTGASPSGYDEKTLKELGFTHFLGIGDQPTLMPKYLKREHIRVQNGTLVSRSGRPQSTSKLVENAIDFIKAGTAGTNRILLDDTPWTEWCPILIALYLMKEKGHSMLQALLRVFLAWPAWPRVRFFREQLWDYFKKCAKARGDSVIDLPGFRCEFVGEKEKKNRECLARKRIDFARCVEDHHTT